MYVTAGLRQNRRAGARRRASAFGRALAAHLAKIRSEPGAYGQLGLSDLFEMREECLREFGFADVYRLDKERENAAALAVLPDLLRELDASPARARLTALVEGVLAANIFDWGAQACVDLYQNGTILEIYRQARTQLSRRPWRVDTFDALADCWFSRAPEDMDLGAGAAVPPTPFRRVIMFVDNAGADVVLGMVPLARELLRMGAEVVLVANSLPAINDITAPELRSLLDAAGALCPTIKAAREAALRAKRRNDGRIPPYPGMNSRVPSSGRLVDLSHGHGSPGTSTPPLAGNGRIGADRTEAASSSARSSLEAGDGGAAAAHAAPAARDAPDGASAAPPRSPAPAAAQREARLYVCSNGQGSPCLDLRRVPDTLADATVGADLVVVEGMGRSIHTNYRTRFRCAALKVAMIKNQHLAESLFGGNVYDCVCLFEPAE